MTLPSLSVVVPVRDEKAHLGDTLRRLRFAVDASPWRGAEIVVVDDGSTDGSGELLDALAVPLGLRVLHQRGSGRLDARLAGLHSANGDLALLVDARVHVDPGALAHVADELATDPGAVLWNGDVTVATAGNPYAGFWSALTVLGWRRYFADRRRTSYGLDEFDLYPKGTTLFLGPTRWLVEDSRDLDTRFTQRQLASDDTALLRRLCARSRINLSPGFACTYHGRDALRPFLRHAFFRGTTFVDGYVGRSGQVGRAATAGLCCLPGAALAARRRPGTAVAVAGAGAMALGVAAKRSGATTSDAVALSVLSPVFSVVFGAGVVRGLVLAAGGALTRQRR